MAVFPLQFFTEGKARVGLDEDYRSSPLGVKYAGQPKGAYVGFIPSVLGSVLTLSPDPSLGYSLVKVASNVDPGGMDVIIDSPVTLNFAGQPDVDFPLNVMMRSSFFEDGVSGTSAEIFTRSDTVPVENDEALICVVVGPSATISVTFDATIGERDEPLAFASVDFGFMPGGSIEDLRAAADIVNEVVAARVGLDSTVHSDLSGRIAEDYSASSIAGRLAVIFRALRSNDYLVGAGEESVVVSGSFSEIDRDYEPKITLSALGSESSEGALASPNDVVRNVALVVDATTGYRPIDDLTERRVIFGRLIGPNERTISGVWQFLNASKNVTATDGNGQAIVEVQVRDTILGPDGNYYEVDLIEDDNSLVLRTAFRSASATAPSTVIHHWTVEFKKIVGGVELDASLIAATTVRFFFPAFVSMARSNFDWKLALHTAAERSPLPVASTTVPGIIALAVTGARLGAVNIKNKGVLLPGGPFHTINFNSVNASVEPTAITGEVGVVEIGIQGDKGEDGTVGAQGEPGEVGPGFSALNPFEISGEFGPGLGAPVAWSFTKNMGHNVRYIAGNIARWRSGGGPITTPGDRLDITNVSIPTATEGRIEGTLGGVTGNVYLRAFLSSAGD